MKVALLRASLLALALSGTVAGGWLVLHPIVPATLSPDRRDRLVLPDPVPGARLDSIADLAVVAAPFRLRRTLAVSYDPTRAMEAGTPSPAGPPKPMITLTGLVRGKDVTAVLDGVPGSEGSRVFARGDTAGGLTVRRIGRDEVVVTGYDTTWTLRLKELQ